MSEFVLHSEISCNCEEECGCVPGFYLTVDGTKGWGSAAWVMDPATNDTFYSCRLFGWEFRADSVDAACRELERRLSTVYGGQIRVKCYCF